MKEAPVLHWPKLFEGWMLTGEYRNHGDGELTGDGLGGGYITGQITAKGNGTGDGYGNGKGSFNGGRNDSGGGTYSSSNGDGWSMRSV
jgi:hypothetical protein